MYGLEKQKETIFESFTQASQGTNRRFSGTGLGLTISQQFVQRMGGRIGVESQLGQGYLIQVNGKNLNLLIINFAITLLKMANQNLKILMSKSVESAQRNFNTIRTGRANTSLLDRISVEYYGVETPLKSLATISTPDSQTITILDKGL